MTTQISSGVIALVMLDVHRRRAGGIDHQHAHRGQRDGGDDDPRIGFVALPERPLDLLARSQLARRRPGHSNLVDRTSHPHRGAWGRLPSPVAGCPWLGARAVTGRPVSPTRLAWAVPEQR